MELHPFLNEGMSPDGDVNLPGPDLPVQCLFGGFLQAAGEQAGRQTQCFHQRPDAQKMLLRQDLRGGHEGDLVSSFDGH